MATRLIVVAALLGTVTAAEGAQSTPHQSISDVVVAVTTGTITSPDSVLPGWTRVRVNETSGSHIVVVFRLPARATDATVAAFIAALDMSPATPAPGIAMGGPEIGQTGEVIVQLKPGRYVLACVTRGEGEHRHVSAGESKTFVVPEVPVGSIRRTPPVASHEMKMTEFSYGGPDKWRAGPQVVRIANTGSQDHQLRLVRLRAGATLSDWLNSDGAARYGVPVVGLARMSPGQVAYLPVDLQAGSYVAYCLVTDPTRKKTHLELGMLRAIQVE